MIGPRFPSFVILALLLLATPWLRADEVAKPQTAEKGPFLWEIDVPDGPIYLAGTMHLGVSAHDDLDPVVWEKMRASDNVIFEANPMEMFTPAVMTMAMLPPGQSMDDLLGPKNWAKLTEQVGGAMPEQLLKRYRPWMIASVLLSTMLPTTASMDMVLMETAKNEGKRVAYMESMGDQVKMLNEAFDVETLKSLLEDPEELSEQLGALLRAYQTGDHAAVAKMIDQQANNEAFKKQHEMLLIKRNKEWLPMIINQLGSGKTFYAVGAAHLVGEEGLIAKLRAQGLSVTHVKGTAAPAAAD